MNMGKTTIRLAGRFGLIMAVAVVFVGCVASPQKQATVVETPAAVAPPSGNTQARTGAQDAIDAARAAVDKAVKLGALWEDSEALLKRAEAAFADGAYDKAAVLAGEARGQADLAVNQYYLEKAKPLLDEAQEYRGALNAGQLDRLQTAEQAYMQSRGKQAYDLVAPLLGEVRAESAALTPTQETFVVRPGDSLWSIAASPEFYDNGYAWPLILRVNADKIHDADLIYPGQALAVDHAVDQAALAAAIEHAKTRGRWSLGRVEMSDLQYLQQWGARE